MSALKRAILHYFQETGELPYPEQFITEAAACTADEYIEVLIDIQSMRILKFLSEADPSVEEKVAATSYFLAEFYTIMSEAAQESAPPSFSPHRGLQA